MNGKEEEIYDILYKKKEINNKIPKSRTEDEKKKLKNLQRTDQHTNTQAENSKPEVTLIPCGSWGIAGQ